MRISASHGTTHLHSLQTESEYAFILTQTWTLRHGLIVGDGKKAQLKNPDQLGEIAAGHRQDGPKSAHFTAGWFDESLRSGVLLSKD